MAGTLTQPQRNKMARILVDVTDDAIDSQVTLLGDLFTATHAADIATELTRWDTAGSKFYAIEPNVRNRGYKSTTEAEKDDIRNNIAVLLSRPDWGGSSGAYEVKMERG